MKHFYNSKDVMGLLDLNSLRTAQDRIKALNDVLVEQGYWVEPGKVPISFFHDKYPYIDRLEGEEYPKATPEEKTPPKQSGV